MKARFLKTVISALLVVITFPVFASGVVHSFKFKPVEETILDRLSFGTDIIAIGESVHGSSEFLKTQARISKYLIEKKGFRTLIVENPLLRSMGITEWVRSCASEASRFALPIDLLYEPVEEDRDFLNWICAYNKSHPKDPIVFRGMDIWDRPWENQKKLEELNQVLSLGARSELALTLKHCWIHAEKDWSQYMEFVKRLKVEKKIPDLDYIPCTESLRAVRKNAEMRMKRARGKELYDLYSVVESVESSLGYQGNFNFAYQGFGLKWNARDQAQAAITHAIWKQEGRKPAILIAHTSHTARMRSLSDWWKTGLGEIRSGVSYLLEKTRLRVKTIGLTGYEVSGTQGVFLKSTSPDSMDFVLHEVGIKWAWINPRNDFVRSKERWWIQNENDKDSPNGVYMIPKDNFDYFFFVDQSLVGKAILPWHDVWNW